MKIIDAHIHFSTIQSFIKTAQNISGVDYSYEGYKKEQKESNIVASIGMGVEETVSGGFPDLKSDNPMILNLNKILPKKLYCCVGINPVKLDGIDKDSQLIKIEKALQADNVKGIKLYAGYYHYHVYDKVYDPVIDLARKYDIPVVIHSGDTYSKRGLLKYSHPINVDELAVKNNDVKFIIAHLGDPWVMDCAEIVYKNSNVYADLSGLIVGDEEQVNKQLNEKLFVEHIKRALVYTDDYSKFLYGSDWPLVDMKSYIRFIKELIPQKHHNKVFYENATKVFGLSF